MTRTLMILPNAASAIKAGFSVGTCRHQDPELAPSLICWWPRLGEDGWQGIQGVELVIVDGSASSFAYASGRAVFEEYERNLHHMMQRFSAAKWVQP